MKDRICLAADIGGSSVKILTVRYENRQLQILEQYSVPTHPVSGDGHLRIDIPVLTDIILDGIRRTRAAGIEPQTLGIDTFGSGYGFLNQCMELEELPYFYKDTRTQGVLDRIRRIVPLYEIYRSSGLFPTDIRVLMQLFYDSRQPDSGIHRCRWLLLLPNLLEFLLTGTVRAEESMASVANLLDADGRQWNRPLLERLGIPTHFLPPLVAGGTPVGPLLPEFARDAGEELQIISVTSHDTESALLAAPALDTGSLFASIGTSLIFGIRMDRPILSPQGYAGAFKTVKGPFHYSLCRDYNAMWLFEQCMETWKRETPDITYEDVTAACLAAGENHAYLNVCDPFLRTEHPDMPEAIRTYCEETGQQIPRSLGETANCVFDSIVLQALWSLRQIQQITGQKSCPGLTAIGGGTKNRLLIQRLADALNIPVTTGSDMSSALGNALMQLYATGELAGWQEIRQTTQNSVTGTVFMPRRGQSAKWEQALSVLDQIDTIKGKWR